MSDRELLETAAKAAGFDVMPGVNGWCIRSDTMDSWNPLADDGDALRLAVKLRLNVELTARTVLCATEGTDPSEAILDFLLDDPYASTRRVIVRAAAEIGKAMP